MLKKLSIAGLALIASTGIAFADTSDSMPATGDNNAASGSSSSGATDASMNNAAGDATATHKHKRHHHKKHHHKKHHYQAAVAPSSTASEQDQVASSAPMGGYKGEVPCPTCVRPPFVVGPYVGFDVGSRINYTQRRAIYTGAEGTLFAGYSMMWDQWFGAIEINAADSAEISNSNAVSHGGSSAKSQWGFGLSVLPGYLITDDVLGYLRLGIVDTRFSTGNNNLFGGQVGLGLETQLCPNWDLRTEYIFDFYNSLSSYGGNPKSQEFNLGLIYKFQF